MLLNTDKLSFVSYIVTLIISFLQVIMLVGLPSAGKTVLAHNHCRENADKQFVVLGRDLISNRMKVGPQNIYTAPTLSKSFSVLGNSSMLCFCKAMSCA